MSHFHIKCMLNLPVYQVFGIFYLIYYKIMLKKELI